jgi:hypothetical protein
MLEKTLQAAICASNLGIGREFTGEMAQIDCSGIHHSQNQKTHRFKAAVAQG